MSYGEDDHGYTYADTRGPAPRRSGTPELRTRKPTGRIAYPFVLVEGEPKGGKSYAIAALSASPRVGRTFVFELGEVGLDEYAPLGPFEMVVHNGTFSDILGQVRAAMAVPQAEGKPNVIAIDSGTSLWTLLKDWTDSRARNSQKGRKTLQADPDAEIDPTMNLWNDAKERWRQVVDGLMAWDGIAVIVGRAGEVAKVENGQPVANQTEYRVEAEKTLVFDVTAQVRFQRGQAPRLVAVKSLFVDLPQGGIDLPREATLDHLVFEVLGGGKEFGSRNVVAPQVGLSVGTAKTRLLDAVKRETPSLQEDEAKAEAVRIWGASGLDGHQEITLAELAAILPGRKTPEAQETAPDGPRTADQAPEAQTASVTLPDPDAVIARILKMEKKDLVPELTRLGLGTSGKVADLRTRLVEGMGLSLEAPFGDPTPKTEDPPAEEPREESPPPAPTTPETPAPAPPADIPEDAWRGECLCGNAIWHQKGDASTVTHVDPTLNADHSADPVF